MGYDTSKIDVQKEEIDIITKIKFHKINDVILTYNL
jgi:hypothetical protein